jgi:hypothetical protein
MSVGPSVSSRWTLCRYWVGGLLLLTAACRSSALPRAAERPALASPPRLSQRAPCNWTVRTFPEADSQGRLVATRSGLVVIDGAGMLVSTDHGRTFGSPPWAAVANEEPRVLTSTGRTLYFGTPSRMYAVEDVDRIRRLPPLPGSSSLGGDSFVFVDFKASDTALYALFNSEVPVAVDSGEEPRKPVYSGHLYRSTDDGVTWAEETRLQAFEHGAFEELLINGSSRRLVADNLYHTLSTVDDGRNWALLPQVTDHGRLALGARSLLLRVLGGALLRSSDAGRTWHPVDNAPSLDELVAAGDEDWSATKGWHFLRSLDDGQHWQQESKVDAQDQLAAECLSAEIVNWTSLWRSDDEGYALGLVNPDMNLNHGTSVTSKRVRLLAHGSCSPAPQPMERNR